MLGRQEAIVEGVEGSSDSDVPSFHKKIEAGAGTSALPDSKTPEVK